MKYQSFRGDTLILSLHIDEIRLYILIQNSEVDDQTATQIITSPDGQNENVTQDVDLEAPTQLQYDSDETGNTTQLLEQEHQGNPIQY